MHALLLGPSRCLPWVAFQQLAGGLLLSPRLADALNILPTGLLLRGRFARCGDFARRLRQVAFVRAESPFGQQPTNGRGDRSCGEMVLGLASRKQAHEWIWSAQSAISRSAMRNDGSASGKNSCTFLVLKNI